MPEVFLLDSCWSGPYSWPGSQSFWLSSAAGAWGFSGSESLGIKSESTGNHRYCSACLRPFSSLFLSPSAILHSSQTSLTSVPPVRILKRILIASREQAGTKLAAILGCVVGNNNLGAWERLFHFSARCLRVPTRCGCNWSLATMINKQLREEEDPPTIKSPTKKGQGQGKPRDPLVSLGRLVSEKLEEGDFKGAVRLACSEDSMADRSVATFTALKEKHPSPHPNSCIPPSPDGTPFLPPVSIDDVARAIRSFPNGSAGGPDGLRPQYVKDMMNSSNVVDPSLELLSALVTFSILVLEGKTPLPICPFFFGATLIALEKKEGGSGQLLWVAPFAGWLPKLLGSGC